MRVGVKYCGGCNPCYDRVAWAEACRREHPEDRFLPAVPGQRYHRLLVICGCDVKCADLTGLMADEIRWVGPGERP